MVGLPISIFGWAKEDQHVSDEKIPADAQTWHDVRANISASTVTILSGEANGKLTETN